MGKIQTLIGMKSRSGKTLLKILLIII